MKIVFVASHSQKNELDQYYERIVKFLEGKGHSVASGGLFGKSSDSDMSHEEREVWYKKSLGEISRSDLVVVEISYPSTANVGHELTYALEAGKPVIALYREGRDPVFLSGRADEKLMLFSYKDDDLEGILASGIDYASSVQDVRFNFFISPSIGRYLDWISKSKRVPRAVYLRKLIEEDMLSNKEYQEENRDA
jgi:nucleoside 2-deoxyribosyltransferase